MERLYFETKQVNDFSGKSLKAYPFFMPYVQTTDISKKSMKVYLNRFVQFIQFLSNTHHVYIDSLCGFQTVSLDMVKEFVLNEVDSQSTKKSKYYALHSLYDYLQKMEIVTTNPLHEIEIPKVKTSPSLNYLSDKEIQKIFKHLEKELSTSSNSKQKRIYRDMALFSLAISTGLKPSLIVQLKKEDYANGFLQIENMNIKLHKQTKKRLETWLEFNEMDMLFVNSRNKSMSVRQFEKVLENYESIVHRKINPQLLRATYAHTALKKNVPTLDIAKQMGITPVSLVTRYLETNV